ncbi:hypothetical protein ABT324_24210 [Saccharopolyspora sp. NPDC000359]|uniref:hypothetical protein n=1 Tax=Saccharopolyspora sp. NPDC000359 TaxID=3154251 RepID=UPI00333364F8
MTFPPQLDRRRLAAGVAKPNTPAERRAAALHVASSAHDAVDCAQLLDMLGLSVADARTEVSA